MMLAFKEENTKLREENQNLRNKTTKYSITSKDNKQHFEDYELLKKEYEKLKKDHKSLKLAFEKLERDSSSELKDVKKEYDSLTSEYMSQRDEIDNLKNRVEGSASVHQHQHETSRLKKLLKAFKEEIGVKDQILKKKDNELALFREDLLNITKSEKKLRAECNRLHSDLERASVEKRRVSTNGNNSRGRSLSPAPRSRASTKSFTRFDPTQYVENKKAKQTTTKKGPIIKKSTTTTTTNGSRNSSRNSSRSSSIERSRSRERRSSGSEFENNNRIRNASRSSTPPRVWSRSPKQSNTTQGKLDPDILKNKLNKLASKTTRKAAVPKQPVKKTRGYLSSDFNTTESETDDYNPSRSRRTSSRYTRRKTSTAGKASTSTHVDLYDTSDSEYN
jgi:myosin heavy subunit